MNSTLADSAGNSRGYAGGGTCRARRRPATSPIATGAARSDNGRSSGSASSRSAPTVTSASHRAGTLPDDRHARSACASARLRDGSGQSFSTARAPSPRRAPDHDRRVAAPDRLADHQVPPRGEQLDRLGQPRPPRRDLFPEAGHEPHAQSPPGRVRRCPRDHDVTGSGQGRVARGGAARRSRHRGGSGEGVRRTPPPGIGLAGRTDTGWPAGTTRPSAGVLCDTAKTLIAA